jgi:large subunit ribosomal protein L17
MKKNIYGRQLSRERDTRRALFRSLARALVLNGKIKTTKGKAKAMQGFVEKAVTLGKNDSVAARRRLYSMLGNDRVTTSFIVEKVVPAFSKKKSGFTRIINLPRRRGDNAQAVRLEWTESIEKYAKPSKSKTKKGKKSDKTDKKKRSDKKKDKDGKKSRTSRAGSKSSKDKSDSKK